MTTCAGAKLGCPVHLSHMVGPLHLHSMKSPFAGMLLVCMSAPSSSLL